jgi:SHS2 domain-containing protein
MGSYRYLEDRVLSDCAVDLTGATLGDVFETAARALAETMVDPATVPVTVRREIVLEAPNRELLLFEWLSELVSRKDELSEVFVRSQVDVSGEGPVRLTARLEGGSLLAATTERRGDPKGITLHEFVLEPQDGGWHARFVVDL